MYFSYSPITPWLFSKVVNQFRFWFSHLHLLHLQREVEIQKEDKERALYSDELELAKLSEEISFQWEITAR